MGLWYEIASYPTFFNKGLVGTTAEYTLNADNTVTVVNRAFQGSFDGPATSITGTAWSVDPETNSKLKVRFEGFPQSLFPGDYWIIDLSPDYQYAIVSDPYRTTLFILSRTPTISEELYNALIARVDEQGFDVERIQKTPQLAQ
jgi:apolipoprotein D and lipocalin family protein